MIRTFVDKMNGRDREDDNYRRIGSYAKGDSKIKTLVHVAIVKENL